MMLPCGCCEGVDVLTPGSTANRPGLPTLAYRVGTHGAFLDSMLARLSSSEFPELVALRTRHSKDLSIAVLDCWAIVADILTFYQERLANEGFLRTATERRSVLELARLIGYRLRPGVAASVFLAYEIDENQSVPVVIPAGAKVQSVPGPGELPQIFETSDGLECRADWNNLPVRRTRPQYIPRPAEAQQLAKLYLKGTATNLRANDVLFFEFADKLDPKVEPPVRFVEEVTTDFQNDRTEITLQGTDLPKGGDFFAIKGVGALKDSLMKRRFLPPQTSQRLGRNASEMFGATSDLGIRVVTDLVPALRPTLYQAWANAKATDDSQLKAVHAFRVKASLFGHNAPPQLKPVAHTDPLQFTVTGKATLERMWQGFINDDPAEDLSVLLLDTTYDQIKPGSWVHVVRPTADAAFTKTVRSVHKVIEVESQTLDVGTFSSKVTILNLDSSWLQKHEIVNVMTAEEKANRVESPLFLRRVTVYAQSEELLLAEEPIPDCVGSDEDNKDNGHVIELSGLVEGLSPGRWLILSGEREDVKGRGGGSVRGVMASELVMLAGVKQDVSYISKAKEQIGRPGDRVHTFLQLADKGLSYCYRRDTVKISGNVVKATHGETRQEVLGSGDASQALQTFALKQPPVTYVSAPTRDGVQSTLVVRVNDVTWSEAESLAGLGFADRGCITKTGDDANTGVIFGNGVRGARLPTGVENIRATYRNGIGKSGNVKSDQLTLLATRPLGVKGVTNPIRASGGADTDSRDQARRNAPLAVMALDRLVATQDYADFARTFGGIGKAHAVRLSDHVRQVVHVTIAGVDDVPIDQDSDLFRNLRKALRDFGDPVVPIVLGVRRLKALIVSADVAVLSDYEWESVEPKIRARLLEAFGFDRRALGQPVFASEVISAIQAVRGVAYVDLNVLDSLTDVELLDTTSLQKKINAWKTAAGPAAAVSAELAAVAPGLPGSARDLPPAEFVFLTPAVPDTLILNLRGLPS